MYKFFREQKLEIKCLLTILLIYLVLLILFEPFFKIDDVYMNEIMVGAYSGYTDCHFIYGNVLVGVIVSGLTNIFPQIAWYALIQVLLCGAAIFLVVIFLVKRAKLNLAELIPFIVFFEYELMIKITFTQTAGACLTFGILYLLLFINDNDFRAMIVGIAGLFLGILFRSAILKAFLGFFFVEVLLFFMVKRIKNHSSIFSKDMILSLLKTVFIIGIIVLMSEGLSKLNLKFYSDSEVWNNYFYENRIKGAFTDYETLSYYDNLDEYKKLQCSENDLNMLKTNNLYYENSWNDDWILKIYEYSKTLNSNSISNIIEMFNLKSFILFFKEFLWNSLCNVGLLITLYGIIRLVINSASKFLSMGISLILFLTYLAENYYLFIYGRAFQKHVDLCLCILFLVLTCFLLANINPETYYLRKNNKIGLCIVLVMVITSVGRWGVYTDYGDYTASNPEYSSELIDYITKDSEHLYISLSRESAYSTWNNKAFQGNITGSKKNIFIMGQYMWPPSRSVLDNYDIKNPLTEIVDSDVIRFFVSDAIEAEQVYMIEKYCQEHVDANSHMIKIDEYKTLNLYECRTY